MEMSNQIHPAPLADEESYLKQKSTKTNVKEKEKLVVKSNINQIQIMGDVSDYGDGSDYRRSEMRTPFQETKKHMRHDSSSNYISK